MRHYYRCLTCGLFFTNTGEPFVPEVCTRCEASITWDGEFYDCTGCGRTHYGPFPRERGARMVVPEGGYARGMPGVVPGKRAGDRFAAPVRRPA